MASEAESSAQVESHSLDGSLREGAGADDAFDGIRDAYEEARGSLRNVLSEEEYSRVMIQGGRLDDIARVVDDAFIFSNRSSGRSLRKWLDRLSRRLVLYGDFLDHFTQQHPEYPAFFWGALRVVVLGVVNHEALLTELARAMGHLADALPRAEFYRLYSTAQTTNVAAQICILLIKFAQRTIGWYKRGVASRLVDSLTRPLRLEFKDIVESVSEAGRSLERLGTASGMAEIRDIQLELERNHLALTSATTQIADHLRSLQSRKKADSPSTSGLSDFQISEISEALADTPLAAPELTRKFYAHARKSRQTLTGFLVMPEEKHLRTLQSWMLTQGNKVALLHASFQRQDVLKTVTVNLVDDAIQSERPIVWLLGSKHNQPYSSIDLVKQLVRQILIKSRWNWSETSLSYAQIHDAVATHRTLTIHYWFGILRHILSDISQLCIIIDVDLSLKCSDEVSINWNRQFLTIFQTLDPTSSEGIKVVLVNYRSKLSAEFLPETVINLSPTKDEVVGAGQLANSRNYWISRTRASRSSRLAAAKGCGL